MGELSFQCKWDRKMFQGTIREEKNLSGLPGNGWKDSGKIHKDQPNEDPQLCLFKLAKVTCILTETQAGRGAGKLSVEKERLQVCAQCTLLAQETGYLTRSQASHHWLGIHIGLSLVSSKLEAGIKIRETGRYLY